MHRTSLLWLSFVCLVLPAAAIRANTPEEDEALLKEAKLATDAAALVDFFRKRVLPENDADKVKALIDKLGDDAFQVRERASSALLTMGPGIAKALRDAASGSDPEVVARVKEALEIVERTSTPALLGAAARLLGHRKPPEAVKVLLDYAPVPDSEDVADAIRAALLKAAVRDGKPEPALVAALGDKHPLRRSLAAETLIRTGNLEGEASRKLLADADPHVRLRTALGLVDRNDKDAVPALIAVLPAVKLQQAWLAEDVLCRLAGDKAPNVSLGDDEPSRKAASEAWEKWWKASAATVDLKKLKETPPYLGFTVIAYQDFNGQGKLMEQDKAGKTRWEFQGLIFPITDVQVLPNERVLISEMNSGRVSERNKKGEIVWQKAVQQPVAVQRLVNGNTMVATRNGVFEYTAAGKDVFTYQRGRWDVMSARKHRNGEYILLTQMAMVRINAQGKEAGSWPIGRNFNYGTFDVLANGNVLVPLTRNNRVVEYNLEGKEIWSANVNFPTSVQRLPNGNTLVTSQNYRTITEFDKTGKQTSQTQIQGSPSVAIRR